MKHAHALSMLRLKFETRNSFLNERARRLWAATEAMGLGHGGIAALAEAIKKGGIALVKDVHETPWGTKELAIKDNQGHTLYFGESHERSVR